MKELIESKWDDILYLLETNYDVSKIIVDTWIRSLEIYEVKNNTVYFFVDEKRGKHGVDYLHKKGYDIFLLSSIREILNNVDIEICIDEKSNYITQKSRSLGDDSEAEGDRTYSDAYYDAVKKSNLNPKYTFENFIVGDSNRHAYATCLAVADLPCQDNFNPLFLYGGSGLGKTHLMQSIAHYILQHNENTNVLYVTSEAFTNDIISAIQRNKTDEFRAKYRQVDVLLIDDIQEIIDRERTQQEFFNTFNFLYEAKKQIIISSDKPPKEIKSLEERLRSRFEWGVPIDIHAPDYETRMAILKNKAELGGLTNIPDEVFKYIAENIVSNVRELEGALNKISIYSKLFNNVSITVDLARDTLKDLISKDNSVTVTPELILNTVAEHMEVSVDDIRSKKRSQDIAIARQLVMYLCRELTDKSLQSIGEIVGGKDHATVHNGVKRIEEKVKDDPQFSAMVQVIIKKINPSDN
jgi:chromosomal replication initiator protein